MTPDSYKKKLEIIFEEKIIGGLADNKTLEDICKKHKCSVQEIENQLKKGMEVETEHTSSEETAKEIAMDHLWEDPKYYDKLDKMEKGACDCKIDEKVQKPKTYAELVKKQRGSWGDVKPFTRVHGKKGYDRKEGKKVDEKKIPQSELEPVNPFAVCTSKVGRENKDKYERCVMHIKDKNKKENK